MIRSGRPNSQPLSAGAMPRRGAPTDAELLHDTTRPADSFTAFYRRHVTAIIRFAASRGADADAAADVVSETFLAALHGRSSYRADHADARVWLLGIAARKLADQHRRRERDRRDRARLAHEAVALTEADRDGYARLLARDETSGLDALAELPTVQQQTIRMRVVEQRGYPEIARRLGLSEPATRQHVSRGLRTLRDRLTRTR